MNSSIFDIEALEGRKPQVQGNVIYLNNNPDTSGPAGSQEDDLEVFDFVPKEPPRPWSLDDVTDSKIVTCIGEWGENAMEELEGSDDASAENEQGRAVILSLGAGSLLASGIMIAHELIK